MEKNPLILDTEVRQNPDSLQPKTIYAGDEWSGQPYLTVTGGLINLYASKDCGIYLSDEFGTTIGGKLSLSTTPDQISIGGGYWRFNPLLLSCIPSTTPTPIPTLVKAMPRLLSAKDDIKDIRNNLILNSDVPGCFV